MNQRQSPISSVSSLAVRALLGVCVLSFALPASAHIDASHIDASHVASGFASAGFVSGLLHPLSGLDHLLAIFAVGVWASQHRGRARRALAVVFPVMMVAGAVLGSLGLVFSGIEAGIAISVAVLGVLIARSIRLSMSVGAFLVACFALAHGYQHVVEMSAAYSLYAYCAGFALSTVLILASGLALGAGSTRMFARSSRRWTGAVIATAGMYFISAVV
ncbi:MAG: HupE/UreJ family protein [Pseudomonadota bacterium]